MDVVQRLDRPPPGGLFFCFAEPASIVPRRTAWSASGGAGDIAAKPVR
jgi:hypothetical protein